MSRFVASLSDQPIMRTARSRQVSVTRLPDLLEDAPADPRLRGGVVVADEVDPSRLRLVEELAGGSRA